MRYALSVFVMLALVGCGSSGEIYKGSRATSTEMPQGELQIEIQSPSNDFISVDGQNSIEIEGVASTIGGVRYLDMVLVIDTSMSLIRTDPDDYRSAGAIGLVRNLSPKSDTKIGIVTFDQSGDVALPMTSDRDRVVKTLRSMNRSGKTDLAAGISSALVELNKNGRPGSSRVIMLFTDGKSNRRKAMIAAQEAKLQGVTVQTLLLGSDKKGAEILDEIAWSTGGSFVQVTDPTMLPEAFLNLKTTGVDSVTLSVNGADPAPAKLAGGTFTGNVPLEVGENQIVARATSLDGRTRESYITVNVRDESCAALELSAYRDGRQVLSLEDRSVQVVVDASRSMWGRMEGSPKMSVAKDILFSLSDWLPEDINLALRAYGSVTPSEENDCSDSSLLVPFGQQERESLRAAISSLKPRGQTPIAYALQQASMDFELVESERAVVLVTDGIESCGGDPVMAAMQLREQGITVHVIGFGLGNSVDEDAASLQAVAEASGGRYITASSAEELMEALEATVGTPYRVYKGDIEVASSALGTEGPIFLPGGEYRVRLDGATAREFPITLDPRGQTTLTVERQGDVVSHFENSNPIEYLSCEAQVAEIRRLEEEASYSHADSTFSH